MAETKLKSQASQELATGWLEYSNVIPTRTTSDDPTYVLTFAGVDLTGIISVGMKIKITQSTDKFFIVTAIAFSTNTTITVYGGTDYDVADTGVTAISAFWYSPHKAPLDFPLDPTKWSVIVESTSNDNQSSPVAGTWYNIGSNSIDIPIGAWHCDYDLSGKSDTSGRNMYTTLSKVNNTEDDKDWTGLSETGSLIVNYTRRKMLVLSTKDTYYLNARTSGSGAAAIRFRGDLCTTRIRAISAYL